MYKRWRLEITLGLLLVLTLIAIMGEKSILRTTLVIDPSSGYTTGIFNDTGEGGNSSIEYINNSKFEWKCSLKDQYAFPFCEYDIFFDPNRIQGVDLSNFTKIKIWMEYEGPNRTLRLYLRNFDPAYSKVGDQSSTKYNQLEFSVDRLKDNSVEFSLSDFFVSNWWVVNYKIPPELSHPQFDNTVIFEVQTGNSNPLGEHTFKLSRVELIGQKITTEKWYLLIMIAWMVIFVVFLVYRVASLGREIKLGKRREKELLEINSLLDVRSQRLEEKSKTDALTGAFNREGIEEALRMGLSEWRTHKKNLSLIIFDVDHFKRINDDYGHAIGDYVLATISRIVRDQIRSKDLFARWGGEEFLLVCRETDIRQAGLIAEKIRQMLEAYNFDHQLRITASFGVAALAANETLEQLFDTADKAMYAAKNQGRNQVVIAAAHS